MDIDQDLVFSTNRRISYLFDEERYDELDSLIWKLGQQYPTSVPDESRLEILSSGCVFSRKIAGGVVIVEPSSSKVYCEPALVLRSWHTYPKNRREYRNRLSMLDEGPVYKVFPSHNEALTFYVNVLYHDTYTDPFPEPIAGDEICLNDWAVTFLSLSSFDRVHALTLG